MDVSVPIYVVDSGDGTPETGYDHATSGIDLWYRRAGGSKVSITEASLAAWNSAHSDGGVEHGSDGRGRLDLPDAAVAAGVPYVEYGGTITGMVVYGGVVEILDPVGGLLQSQVIGSTGNTTTALHASFLSTLSDDEVIGELWWVFDVSAGEWHPAWVTDFANTGDIATVISARDGGALPFTPEASVDRVWRSGFTRGNLLATGAISSTTFASGAINAAAIATDAITAAKIASDAITAAKIATGAITAAKFAADAITSTVLADGAITANKIASNALAAAKFAAGAFDAVWSVSVRILTAGTNIALAKGTGVTGFNDLDAAGVRSAVGLSTNNLDTQLGDLPTNSELSTALAAADDAVLAAIAALNDLDSAGAQAAAEAALAAYTAATAGDVTDALDDRGITEAGGVTRIAATDLAVGGAAPSSPIGEA
ncbi:MAG: hypothetical protein AB7R40_23430 [Nitrospiraceae bacterium]